MGNSKKKNENENRVLSDTENIRICDQIDQLKYLTDLTGTLHEIQILQLKMWPRVLFDSQEHKIEYDSDLRTISITISVPIDSLVIEKAVKLEEWVQRLLGDNWLFTLKYEKDGNIEEIFRGERKSQFKEAPSSMMKSQQLLWGRPSSGLDIKKASEALSKKTP